MSPDTDLSQVPHWECHGCKDKVRGPVLDEKTHVCKCGKGKGLWHVVNIHKEKATRKSGEFGEPWVIFKDERMRKYDVFSNDVNPYGGNEVVMSDETYYPTGPYEEYAERIVACINALEGCPDPDAFIKTIMGLLTIDKGTGYPLRSDLQRSLDWLRKKLE